MKTLVDGKGVHIYGYDEIDPAALDQLYDAMKQPWVVKGALMPDAHKGYSLPIGGVVATQDMIVPAYVGYDIGCGMYALQLKGVGIDEVRRHAKDIFSMIYDRIPVGQNHRKQADEWILDDLSVSDWFKENFKDRHGERQIGTLGGGNHFIEIGWDKDGDKSVWIVIHSGSRGIGHNTATHYMRIAGGGKVREGHYPFDVMSDEGKDYIKDMDACLAFALDNRMAMANEVFNILMDVLGHKVFFVMNINRNHNHAEKKDGLWIHRKGATHAEKGMYGVIPGNMRDGSFIVRGKGNEDGLCSSSHGAGRLFSRTKAKATLSKDVFEKEMSGITAKVGKSTLDESAGAYKNINMVMENQEDLVEVIAHIVPVINVKA